MTGLFAVVLVCWAFKWRKPAVPGLVFDSTGIVWYAEMGPFSEPRIVCWQWDDFIDAHAYRSRGDEGGEIVRFVLRLKPNVPNLYAPWFAKFLSKVTRMQMKAAEKEWGREISEPLAGNNFLWPPTFFSRNGPSKRSQSCLTSR